MNQTRQSGVPAQSAATGWVGHLDDERVIAAIRFRVDSNPSLDLRQGMLLADAAHHRFTSVLARTGNGTDEPLVLGRDGAQTAHRHAHWLPLPGRTGLVEDLLIWVPAKLTATEVATILATSAQPLTTTSVPHATGSGLPATRLSPLVAGPVGLAAEQFCGPHSVWQTVTPYLPVRHRKARQDVTAFLIEDLTRECASRGVPAPISVTRLDPDGAEVEAADFHDVWARGFRRYRLHQTRADQHTGLRLQLAFAAPVRGPLCLGRLSHFGLGLFRPIDDTDKPTTRRGQHRSLDQR